MINKIKVGDLELSRLMIGTVQFGMNYGVANKTGQVTYESARDIIAYAYENGVNCLDTSAAYGCSEEVIGRALKELGLTDKFIVVTKHPPVSNDPAVSNASISKKEVDELIESSAIASLKRLKMEQLPFYFFHWDCDAKYMESLLKIQEKGLVKNIGSSIVMTPDAASLMDGRSQALQIPFNIIDRRPFENNIFEKAIETQTALFVRSVYLQGLLLMSDDKVPPYLKDIIHVRKKLQEIAVRLEISFAELCMRFVLSMKAVTSIVVGVDTLEQMKQNIALFNASPLDEAIINEIKELIPLFPDNYLAPHLWPKAKV